MNETVMISSRFCGPDIAGNGGYTCGLVAAPLGAAAAVTLRAPAPLDTPLDRIVTEARVELRAGDRLIAEATRATPSIDRGEVPRVVGVDTPIPALPRDQHVFARCFVCGPDRAEHDGLRIMPGTVAGHDHVVATSWTPSAGLAPIGTPIPVEMVWAALDCPGAWAFAANQDIVPMVLGRLVGQLHEPVLAGRKLTVVGWRRGSHNRKFLAGSAIVDGDRVLAVAEAVWIQVEAAAWQAMVA